VAPRGSAKARGEALPDQNRGAGGRPRP
jgi:hypothetical protein